MFLKSIVLCLLLALGENFVFSEKIQQIPDDVWDRYKLKFNKIYRSNEADETARNTYAQNLELIKAHNVGYRNGSISYKLLPNQFTDIPFETIQARFPRRKISGAKCTSNAKFNLNHTFPEHFSYKGKRFQRKIHDQGVECNTGWAYAAATTLEIFRARASYSKIKTVSVQHLIDCAGSSFTFSNQTTFKAFLYLAKTHSPIYDESDYPKNPSNCRGNCMKPKISNFKATFTLNNYYTLCRVSRLLLRHIIQRKSPVVVPFQKLSFEFFHYAEGIFIPPANSISGSHYMSIIGYDTDASGLKYWKLQNSFGTTWGENGYIRLPFNKSKMLYRRILVPVSMVENNQILLL